MRSALGRLFNRQHQVLAESLPELHQPPLEVRAGAVPAALVAFSEGDAVTADEVLGHGAKAIGHQVCLAGRKSGTYGQKGRRPRSQMAMTGFDPRLPFG
jgi:hypothetical protein